MGKTATEVLRAHAIERHLRAAIRSGNMDGDMGSTPRMSPSAWIASCAMTRGVPEFLLTLLGVFFCQPHRWTVRQVLIEIQGQEQRVGAERVAVPLTLPQAAAVVGLNLTHAELKALRLDAIGRVTENQMRRVAREEIAA